MNLYNFVNTRKENDQYKDYNIYFKNKHIGILQTVENDVIFIRQIHIYDEYKRKNHATKIIDFLLNQKKKDIKLCVATNSQSAIAFWKNYFKEKNVTNIRGEIYQIKA